MPDMKRREVISLLGGAVAASSASWPRAARAQQAGRMRRVGVLSSLAEDDPESRAQLTAFAQTFQQLGWTDQRNVQIDYRWGDGSLDRMRDNAAAMAAWAPDVVLASGASALPMVQATRTVPIVFVLAIDVLGAGLVSSLAHPGGNATGFTLFEYSLSTKWLELLKEIAPDTTDVAVLQEPAATYAAEQLATIQAVAPALRVKLKPVDVRDAEQIERDLASAAGGSNGGLIVTAGAAASAQRNLIIRLALAHRLPAVYFARYFVTAGGLMSYGADFVDQFRQAAGYVSRILKGDKPADLPVQAPTRYELVINLNTAKALGLTIPPSLLARADEVIE
jgi:putative ABC transport system substrate-binding protein